MVFIAALLSNVLLASVALARPSLSDRLERRREGSHLSRPRQHVDESFAVKGNASHVDYSSNWSGAVLVATKATYKAVTASFIVPTPKAAGSGSSYSASAWVGIDGDTWGNSILQTGLDFTITNGRVSYDAWYEWYPDYAYDFSGISFSAGDSVTITVTATSTKAGTAVIKNNTTGKSVSKSLTSSAALGELNAEWIVEDYEEGSSLVPFANFGTVTFTGAQATTVSGTTVGPSGADIIDLKQGSTVLTSVSSTSNSVTVTYV